MVASSAITKVKNLSVGVCDLRYSRYDRVRVYPGCVPPASRAGNLRVATGFGFEIHRLEGIGATVCEIYT